MKASSCPVFLWWSRHSVCVYQIQVRILIMTGCMSSAQNKKEKILMSKGIVCG